ncbi:MAG: YkgJ family cysteine cluster protein [Cyclobacteriaceae bacterium]|nr:YkgJ family cysteine cluster protein [Cyclobacteriaceae bacterium]
MTLPEKIEAVERLFVELDERIAHFQQKSGLFCPPGCGKCCLKPDIEATVLEFLPFAWHMYKAGTAEMWYEKVKSVNDAICVILNPQQQGQGWCSQYPYRGLICRLFGYSARHNKYGGPELITCSIIRDESSYSGTVKAVEEGSMEVPYMRNYYMQLQGIDPVLSAERLPINQAIARAMESVMAYMAYR